MQKKTWSRFWTDDTKDLLNSIINTIDESRQSIVPPRNDVFEMFKLQKNPENIRLVIVGQSPYPSLLDACGIPFVSAKKNKIPESLNIIKQEIERQYDVKIDDPNEMITSWVKNEGVFIINASPTMGTDIPYVSRYMGDHSVLWMDFIILLLQFILKNNDIPIVLIGKNAGRLESYIKTNKYIIKVPYPVSRSESTTSFLGCGLFVKIDNIFDANGCDRIKWI